MDYCKTALKLLKIKTICGAGCPIVKNCPRLILEEATDRAVEGAIEAMLKVMENE